MKKLLWILLGWFALSSFASPWPMLAIEGFYMRMEGLITWVILFMLGSYYWKVFPDLKGITTTLFIGICAIIFLQLYTLDLSGDF
jgi:hypothetical protein